MKVFIGSRKNQDQATKKKVLTLLKNLGIKPINNPQKADLAIILGGDGTFLFWQSKINCPMLGIRTRGVGYYMQASKNNFLKGLKIILNGKRGKDYFINKFLRLEATLNGKILPPALNEYLVSSGLVRKMFNSKLKVRGKGSLERNSGIIIYTPTGSNAFASATGAKKLAWAEKKIGIVALAPYSGRLKRGETLLDNGKITLECLNKIGEICIDGQDKYTYKIKQGDKIKVRKSSHYALVLDFNERR